MEPVAEDESSEMAPIWMPRKPRATKIRRVSSQSSERKSESAQSESELKSWESEKSELKSRESESAESVEPPVRRTR